MSTAQDLYDGGFWLPPEFLNVDDMLMDFIPGKPNSGNPTGVFNKASSGFHSDLGSPVESITGSTQTESDEDGFINGLTRKLANTTVHEDFWRSEFKNKVGSEPQTLSSLALALSPLASTSEFRLHSSSIRASSDFTREDLARYGMFEMMVDDVFKKESDDYSIYSTFIQWLRVIHMDDNETWCSGQQLR